jgi:hypothetical protein
MNSEKVSIKGIVDRINFIGSNGFTYILLKNSPDLYKIGNVTNDDLFITQVGDEIIFDYYKEACFTANFHNLHLEKREIALSITKNYYEILPNDSNY